MRAATAHEAVRALAARVTARVTTRVTTCTALGTMVCVLAATPAHTQSAPARADSVHLSLEESLDRAARLSTAVLLANDSLTLSGARVLEAYGAFLPAAATGAYALSAQGNTLISSTALVPSQAGWYSAAYQVSTGLNLFNGFRDRASLQAANFLRDAAGFSLAEARQSISFDVLQSYFQVVLDHELGAVAASNLALSRSRQARLEGEVQVGTRAPPDLFRQRAQAAADEASVIDLDARAQTDLVGLLRRLRLEATHEYSIEIPALDTTPLPLDSLDMQLLASRALAQRPDLRAAMSRASAADAGITRAAGGYLPQVVVGASFGVYGRNYEWERQNGANLLTQDQAALGSQLGSQGLGIFTLGLVWPLFDQFQTRYDVERARNTANTSAVAVEDARLRVLGDVRQATDDYRAALQKLRATVAGLASAREAFDAVSARYDVGLGIFLDVQAAQTALADAEAQEASAEVNLVLRRQVLRYVTGAPISVR